MGFFGGDGVEDDGVEIEGFCVRGFVSYEVG